MSVDSESILHIIETAAAGPAEVRGDAGLVRTRTLSELIEAHKYLSNTGDGTGPAPGSTARRGLRFSKIIPPGAV